MTKVGVEMQRVFGSLRTKMHKSRRRSARDWQAQAQRNLLSGDLHGALQSYERALAAHPDDVRLRLKVAVLHTRLGDVRRAVSEYSRAAEQLAEQAHDLKAAAIYRQLLALYPRHDEARKRLGDLYRRLDRRADALAEYRTLLTQLRDAGDDEKLVSALARIAQLDPWDVEVRLELARRQAGRGDCEAARRERAELLRELKGLGDLGALARTAEAALRDDPDDASVVAALARARLELQEPAAAVEALQESLPVLRGEVEMLELLATAYEALGDSGSCERTWYELAELHKRRGDLERMREIFQRNVLCREIEDSTPSDAAVARKLVGNSHLVSPGPVDSRQAHDTSGSFARISASRDEDEQSHRDLAVAFIGMHAYQRALEELECLRRERPDDVNSLALMATCMKALGRPESAVALLNETLHRAHQADYAAVPLRYELAEAHLAAGNPHGALEAFRRVASEGPGFRDTEARIPELEQVLAATDATTAERAE